ncbi:hypothetical protein BJF78_05335 [Pseudonocardia sp. CNS-139]|nr:hypothetical protein BJF78_05335 [Pseudonocardia sp. CNS-139]
MVRLAGVRKSYPGVGEVLAGVDLEVRPGRPVVVVGGNGSGKSTLLRIAAGATAPTAGTVTGRPAVVGFLPGRVPASPRMPVRAYLRHLAALHGVPRSAAGRAPSTMRPSAAEILDALGFSGDADAPVAQLSSGNVQKVGLAQALSCGAGLVVLDEPWAALDARAAAALDGLLPSDAAVLVADHTGRGPALPGAHVLRLAGGRLTQEEPAPDGPPDEAAFTVVELRCTGDPAAALRVLPAVREWWSGPGSLTVQVPVTCGDAVLVAALRHGCSVLGVWRE